MIKRAFDVVVSAFGLIVLAPLFLIIALAIRCDSGGPVLFRQERVGRHSKSFRILKFRTMRSGGQGPQLTVGNDARITRIGYLLRRCKFDELPQLANVIAGHMSLVGPRPEVPRYVAYYPPGVRDIVLSVRPGITDPASIAFIDEASTLAGADDPERMYIESIQPRKLAEYVKYVEGGTFGGDLRIIGRTITRLFSRRF